MRELRASARRAGDRGQALVDRHLLVMSRTSERTQGSEAARRRRELERLALALGAHDPERTLARGYALVQDPARRAARIGRGRPRRARASGCASMMGRSELA